MSDNLIQKVHSGCRVDGIDLLRAHCGCGGLTGAGGRRGAFSMNQGDISPPAQT